MFKNYLQLMLRLSIFVFSLSAFAQTPPTITGSGSSTSAICSGSGSISVNLTAGATPYNLVNSDLSALPAGAVVGGENYTPTFTAGNPHYVQLTPASNEKRGFITFAETALKPVAFSANFGLYVGNGNGADGTSFNYGHVNTSTYNYGEAGMIDSGLAIGFHDYTNKIKIYYNNVELQSYDVNGTLNNSNWKSVSIQITTSGQLTLAYGGRTYCTNYQLPAAYVTDNKSNWKFGFAARCGGLNNLHAINDVVIADQTPMQYSVDGTHYNNTSTFSNLIAGTYDVYARIGDAAYNASHNTTVNLGTQTITGLSVAATLTPTNPTTCTATGSIAISNLTHNMVSYDLVNVSLTNNQLGNATIGNLGTGSNPYFGNGDLVLTPNASSKAGYIAFNTTIAQPNAFSANYDVYVGGGNGGDGLSFNYGVLNTAGTAGVAETGMVNSGLAIGFSDYANTIKIYYNKTELQSYSATVNSNSYKSVAITVTQDGKITIVHGGITICSNYQLPAAYATDNKSNWQYALAARTGGSTNYHSIKNVVIKDNDIQFIIDDSFYTTATTFTGLATGNHTVFARQSNGVHCSNTFQVGTANITYTPDITATVSSTSPITCTTEGGTITISNVSHGLSSPYDLVNVSLTNQQLGAATIGNLGTCCNPIWGGFGDLVLTPNTSDRAGYIAFNTTVAQPNAFSANYDVYVGGGNGGDGLSFNYGDLNTSGSLGGAESGIVNSGLAIGFSDYSNTIKIYYNKVELQSYNATVNSNSYKSVAITVTQDGKLTIVHGGVTICSDYQLPAAYATDSKSSWQYALAARCGGSNNYHSVKNVVIKDNSIQYTINGINYTENPNFTDVYPSTYNVRARISNGVHCAAVSSLDSVTIIAPPGMVAITEQPSTTNQSVALNATATTLSVTATGEATISYQWLSNTVAINNGGNPIVGANSASYTPPTSAAGTLYYYCAVSNACSEVNSAISGSVTTYIVPPNISYTTPVTYTVGTPIAPLTPTNTGGAVDGIPTMTSTFAGSGTPGFANGTGTAASFRYPKGLTLDASDNLYVADIDNYVIRKITPAGVVTTFSDNTGIDEIYQMRGPQDIVSDSEGNFYSTDRLRNRIHKLTSNGVVSVFAGGNHQSPYPANGVGTAANFGGPWGIAINKNTNDLYVAEVGARIRKITSSGAVTTFAGSGAYGNENGTGTSASFGGPRSIIMDSSNNLYVTTYNLIRKITPAGVVTTFAGNPSLSGYSDGIGTAATFNYPEGLAIDALGNLYVGNEYAVRKISPEGVVTTIAGSDIAGSTDGTTPSFNFISGLALDSTGKILYVSEDSNRIRKIVLGSGGYFISPSLPAGLSLDATTGIISGTPTVASAATDYVVTTSNAGGSSSFTINIQITSCNVVLNPASQTNIACHGGSTGAATVNAATGGTAPYTYNWTSGTLTADGTTAVTGLSAGTWTCTVTDANGCSATRNFTITQPSALALTPASQTNVACHGGSTGAATVNAATGGTAPYTYNWTSGTLTASGTTSVTGLSAGTWTCTVTDAYSCTATKDFTITEPTTVQLGNVITETACGSYTWDANGQTYTTSGEYTHENAVSNSYCDATTETNGCETGDEFISNVTIGAINKTSLCGNSSNYNDFTSHATAVVAGSSYPISVTNPQSYSSDVIKVWADWNQDGDFTDSGEEYSLNYSHNNVNGLGLGTGSIAVPAGASNGNVRMRIRLNDDYGDEVDGGEQTLPCGNSEYGEIEDYTLVVSGGVTPVITCTTYDKLVLTINAIPAAPTASAQTFTGSATVADLVATGTHLEWYSVLTSISSLNPGGSLTSNTYYVSQTVNSCESERTAVAVTVSAIDAPTASAQTFCGSKTVADLTATGTDLQWYNVATNGTALITSTALATGTYFVSQTISGSESPRTSVAVTVTPSTSNTTTESVCDTYTWSVNGTTYTTSGTYTSVVDCHTETLNLTITPSTSNATSATGCDSYTWSVNGTIYTNSGTYTSVVGCHTETLNLTITPISIVFTTQPVNTSICNKFGTVNLTAAITPITGATYQWKVQTATGTVWENVNNSSVHYSGATTPVLNIQQATALLNNNKYKLVVTAPTSCGSVVTSDICVLTVNPIPTGAVISGAGTICENSSKTLRIANTLVGSVQWQVSTVDATTGFTDIEGATGSIYTTDALTSTTYYRVVVSSGVCDSKTSPAVTVTVIPLPVAGTINGGDVTVCANATSGLDLSGNSVPFSNSTLLSVAGTTGAITWQKSTNYINNTGATPVWTAAGSTTSTFTASALTIDTWYRVLVSNGACTVASTPVKITVTKAARAGVVSSPSSVCSGGDITFTSSAYTGTSIQWEVSTTSATSGFTPIADANQLSFTMNAVAYASLSKFYVRSVVTSGDCSIARSAVKTITVSPQSVAGTVTGGGIICSGVSKSVTVTGYTGAIQWQSSTDGISYVNVTGSATSATYSASNITANTYFRAKITSGICSVAYSNAVQYTIGTAVAGTLTAADLMVCKGSGTSLTLSGSVGSIKWWKSTNWTATTPTWSAVSSTATTVSTGNLSVSTAYKAEVTIGSCSIVTTEVVPVMVNAAPLAKTITANVTSPTGTTSALAICNTSSTSKVLTIGGGSVGAIQWQKSTTSATLGFVDIADATGTSYTVTNPTVGANYFRAKFTNSCGVSVFGTAIRVYYKECAPTKAITSVVTGKTSFAVVSYPNPFSNNFNLDVTSSSSEKVSVVVYDMIGRLLEKHLENVSEINTLEIGTNYPAGVYNVIVTQGLEVKTVRVIKK